MSKALDKVAKQAADAELDRLRAIEAAAIELRVADRILAAHPGNDTTSRWERKLDRVERAESALDKLLPPPADDELEEEE